MLNMLIINITLCCKTYYYIFKKHRNYILVQRKLFFLSISRHIKHYIYWEEAAAITIYPLTSNPCLQHLNSRNPTDESCSHNNTVVKLRRSENIPFDELRVLQNRNTNPEKAKRTWNSIWPSPAESIIYSRKQLPMLHVNWLDAVPSRSGGCGRNAWGPVQERAVWINQCHSHRHKDTVRPPPSEVAAWSRQCQRRSSQQGEPPSDSSPRIRSTNDPFVCEKKKKRTMSVTVREHAGQQHTPVTHKLISSYRRVNCKQMHRHRAAASRSDK